MPTLRLLSRLATRDAILPAGAVVVVEPGEAALLVRIGCAEALPDPAGPEPMSPTPALKAGGEGDAGGGDPSAPPPAPPREPRRRR